MSEQRQCECCSPMTALGGKKASELLGESELAPARGSVPPWNPQPRETEAPSVPYKVFYTPDSGEMNVGPDGYPRCPVCDGSMQRCGLDDYKCQKCGEGWTLTAIQ